MTAVAIVHPRHPWPRPDPAPVSVQPPGQLEAFPPAPAARATSYRIVHLHRRSIRSSATVRDLPVAAARAATAAGRAGEAWIVAADGTSCRVDADGTVTVPGGELSGWPLLAARVITRTGTPS